MPQDTRESPHLLLLDVIVVPVSQVSAATKARAPVAPEGRTAVDFTSFQPAASPSMTQPEPHSAPTTACLSSSRPAVCASESYSPAVQPVQLLVNQPNLPCINAPSRHPAPQPAVVHSISAMEASPRGMRRATLPHAVRNGGSSTSPLAPSSRRELATTEAQVSHVDMPLTHELQITMPASPSPCDTEETTFRPSPLPERVLEHGGVKGSCLPLTVPQKAEAAAPKPIRQPACDANAASILPCSPN